MIQIRCDRSLSNTTTTRVGGPRVNLYSIAIEIAAVNLSGGSCMIFSSAGPCERKEYAHNNKGTDIKGLKAWLP